MPPLHFHLIYTQTCIMGERNITSNRTEAAAKKNVNTKEIKIILFSAERAKMRIFSLFYS